MPDCRSVDVGGGDEGCLKFYSLYGGFEGPVSAWWEMQVESDYSPCGVWRRSWGGGRRCGSFEVSLGSLRPERSFKIVSFRKLVCMIASCQKSRSGSRSYNLYFEVGLGPIFNRSGGRQTSKQVLTRAAQGSQLCRDPLCGRSHE